MRIANFIVALVMLVLISSAWSMESPRYRLLLQVSEASLDKLNLALNNAKHVQKEFGPENIEIEIIVFGDGVQTLKYYIPTVLADKVKQSTYNGIRIVACENAMRAQGLRPTDMLQEVRYVSSGIAEIVEKQTQGWTYIKP